MKYRRLGKTELMVSEIGFGAWGISGSSYGPTDDNESVRALQCAFDNGVNFYDTSDSYGSGHSEKLIGEALIRDKVIIATKVGCLPHKGPGMPQDFSAKHIKQGIEASLRRLHTDYIDLYQLHSPPANMLTNDKVIETLEGLKKQGKVRYIGASIRSPGDGLSAMNIFDCIQANFNLIDHRLLESGFLDSAIKEDIGIIARTPFVFGFLTGMYSDTTEFASGDHRLNWSKKQLRRWAESTRLFTSLCNVENCTSAQLALRFCLSYDGISTIIPGMVKCWEVEENVKSSCMGSLSAESISTIKGLYESKEFFEVRK